MLAAVVFILAVSRPIPLPRNAGPEPVSVPTSITVLIPPPAPPSSSTSTPAPPAPPDKDPLPGCGVEALAVRERWIQQASEALVFYGESPIIDREGVEIAIVGESSGDPCAEND